MRKPLFKILLFLLLTCCLSIGQSVKLGWCPSPSANVAGYYVVYGIDKDRTNWVPSVYYHPTTNPCPGQLVSLGSNWYLNYTGRIDVGNVTMTTVSNLLPGVTYYFSVVAYSSFGDEAPPSNEVKYNTSPTNTLSAPKGFRLISLET